MYLRMLGTVKRQNPDTRRKWLELKEASVFKGSMKKLWRPKATGNNDKPFKCHHHRSRQRSDRSRHGRTSHSEVKMGKSFKCKKCGKSVLREDALNRHEMLCNRSQKTSMGSNPFRCSICDKIFTRKGNLKRHQEILERSKPRLF